MGKLTALQVKSAKPKDKQDKLTDGEGLYLLVMPNGSKYWRYDYRYQDKRKTLEECHRIDVRYMYKRGLL